MHRLGLEAMVDETVRLDGRVAGSGSGRKVLTLVASMLVGGCCIDDVERLRAGASQAVCRRGGPDCGAFLRSFTFGHVRQLDKAAELALRRAWSVGAAPDVGEMTVDLDSTVCEVCGRAKHGAATGPRCGAITRWWRCSDTGEVLHSRMRSGSSQRGNERFARETLARVRRLAAHAAVTVRADAGFFSYDMIAAIGAHGLARSSRSRSPRTPRSKQRPRPSSRPPGRPSPTPAAARPRWLRPPSRPAAAATSCAAPTRSPPSCAWSYAAAACSAPRASCGPSGATTASSPTARTSTPKPPTQTIAATPRRARHQRPQRELRAQPLPLRTVPRQRRLARLLRARAQPRPLGGPPRAHPPRRQLTVAATIRNRLLTVPGRLVNHSGRHRLRLPLNWPWAHTFTTAATNPQPAPTHLSRPQRPAQRSPTPPATNPHQPRTSPAPQSCTPQNAPARTHAPAQRPPGPNRRSHKPVGGFRISRRRESPRWSPSAQSRPATARRPCCPCRHGGR